MFLHLKNNFLKVTNKLNNLFFSLTIFIFIFSSVVNAEVYEIFGIAFDVKNVTEVSDAVFKVEDEKGISFFNKFELESYLINKRFSALTEFEDSEIESFFKKALKKKQVNLGSKALRALSLNSNIEGASLVNLLNSLESSAGYLELLKVYSSKDFEKIERSDLNTKIATHVFLKEPGFLRKKAPAFFYSNLDELKEATLKNFYAALIEYNIKDLKNLYTVLSENFSIQDGKVKKALVLYDRCGFNDKNINLINDRKNLSQVFDYYQIVYQDVELNNNKNLALKEKYVNKLHLIISEALSNKEYNTAAHFFSLIPVEWRTPTTHAHALETIKNIESTSLVLVGDVKAISLFTQMALNDSDIRDILEVKMEQALKWYLSAKKFKQANIVLNYLKKLHPDSEVKYLNKIYISFAKNYMTNSDRIKAELYLSKVKGFIGVKNFLWFLVNSYYIPVYLIISAIGLIFLFILIRSLEFKKKPKFAKEQSEISKFLQKVRMKGYGYGLRQKHEKSFDGFIEQNRRFAQNRSSMKDPRVIEYEKLLINLGITKNSSLQDIKDSYRRQVKLVHPDVSKKESDAKRFVELTKVYERLIELYDELNP